MPAASVTSSAHTAGPWFISNSENPDVYNGQIHLMIVDTPTHTCVADIETKPEAEANARLIAAAPDLLVACKESLAWQKENFPQLVANGWKELQAAIAKAEGRE